MARKREKLVWKIFVLSVAHFFFFSFSFLGGERIWTIDVPPWWSWSCARFGISWGLASRLHGNELGKCDVASKNHFRHDQKNHSREFSRTASRFASATCSSFDRCLMNTLFSLSVRCNRTEQRMFTSLPLRRGSLATASNLAESNFTSYLMLSLRIDIQIARRIFHY